MLPNQYTQIAAVAAKKHWNSPGNLLFVRKALGSIELCRTNPTTHRTHGMFAAQGNNLSPDWCVELSELGITSTQPDLFLGCRDFMKVFPAGVALGGCPTSSHYYQGIAGCEKPSFGRIHWLLWSRANSQVSVPKNAETPWSVCQGIKFMEGNRGAKWNCFYVGMCLGRKCCCQVFVSGGPFHLERLWDLFNNTSN